MNEYKYILEPYEGMNSRFHCPSCKDRNKTFSRYIDTETGEHLSPIVGRCSRESKCGYHYKPKQYFEDNNISFDTPQPIAYKQKTSIPKAKDISFIPVEVFKASLKGHKENNFVNYLISLFGLEITGKLISLYFIGTSKLWNGATVFWQLDRKGKIRTGKIMLYNPDTGKRVKKPYNYINWVHKVIKQPEFELKQCLFGEHLLIDKTKPVAIVESEKTAIIANVYLPNFIWLATGSLSNLSEEKCNILKGRNVTLFPDLNGFEKWSNKAKELSHIANFYVSDLLERKANEEERKQGLDLADYLIRFSYKEFIIPEPIQPTPATQITTETKPIEQIEQSKQKEQVIYFDKPEATKPEDWEQDIKELESYFSETEFPTQPVKLNQCSVVSDVLFFIESHFATVKANNGKKTYLPYLNRLKELKQVLILNEN